MSAASLSGAEPFIYRTTPIVGQDAIMSESFACPGCGSADLVSGVIVGRSPGVKFKGSMGLAGDLSGIRLTKGVFNHSAPAFRCDECGTVVVPPER